MSDIRYVCFSDMHFGAENSLFTNVLKDGRVETDIAKPSPVMNELVNCLKLLLKQNADKTKPVLILNGDILELALSTTNQAAMVFNQFISLILPEDGEGLFERIIFIPGNHDHHLWEIARETQYAAHIMKVPLNKPLKTPWHTTNLFEDKRKMPEMYFLKKLLERFEYLKHFEILTVYPNFGILDENMEKGVYFHHGHYIEPIYTLMSKVIEELSVNQEPPSNIWDIEAENFAWIDFFWSALGRSGRVGRDVSLIYDKMQNSFAFKELLNTLAKNLVERYSKSWWGRRAKRKTLQWMFGKLYDRFSHQEKKEDTLLSQVAKEGLNNYIQNPLYWQIKSELKDSFPSDIIFIFGHTHKPFENIFNINHFNKDVKVYNSGGWVVEETTKRPLHGGAMILLDEDFNTVSLRMYNEHKTPGEYCIEVNESLRYGENHSEFYKKIKGLSCTNDRPWKIFSEAAAKAVDERIEILEKRIKEAI